MKRAIIVYDEYLLLSLITLLTAIVYVLVLYNGSKPTQLQVIGLLDNQIIYVPLHYVYIHIIIASYQYK